MIYLVSLFCTTFPVVIVLLLFVLTWKSLYGADKGGRPSGRFDSKRSCTRHHRTTTVKNLKSKASCTAAVDDASISLHVPVSTELYKILNQHLSFLDCMHLTFSVKIKELTPTPLFLS